MKKIELPKGVIKQDLQDNWNICESEYATSRRRMKVLDLADRGMIWDIISRDFPEYQITPDTNYVNYVKENILASVYTVGRGASLMPRSKDDQELVAKINSVLETLWGILNVKEYQLKAGERAALLNLGVTQIGWKNDIVGGTDSSWYEGDVVLKNIDPTNYYRDPFANTLDDAAYVIYHDKYHRSVLMGDPDYAAVLKDINPEQLETAATYTRDISTNPSATNKYYNLIIHWVKVYDEDKKRVVIHEIHTISNQIILQVKEDIQPSAFPFAELYSSIPVKDPIGVSEPARILSSNLVLNLLDGILVTHAYKAQRPPRFISDQSGLNLRAFRQYGNDPDKTFIVRGKVTDAVQYMQFPPLPQGMENVALRLSAAIERMSGIDAAYTGKDTGSILTTGGIDSMLAQATMRDTTRIRLYEEYTTRLTRLIIQHLIVFGDKRSYTYKNQNSIDIRTVELDFPKVSNDILFNYSINIDAEIPKNKARMAAAADAMLEKSMQYQANPEIITIEEWLMYQDYPQKDLILARLKEDRSANMTEQVAQVLSMFSGMVEQGVDPNQAIDMVVQQLQGQGQQPQSESSPPTQMPMPM